MARIIAYVLLTCLSQLLHVTAQEEANVTEICPKLCINYAYEFECVESDCTAFPLELIDYPASVVQVNVSFNSITSVPVLPLPEVTHLDLSNNKITRITEGAFAQCVKLQHLNLSFNLLAELNAGLNWRQPSPVLQHLDFSNNLIATIEEQTFRDFQGVLTLNLSSNKITNMTINTLGGLQNLEVLNLADNSLTIIGTRYFLEPRKLQFLSLRRNKITTIQNDAFQDIRDSLLRLDLGENLIEELNHEVFHIGARHPFTKLQAIHLDHNKLKMIHNETFGSLVGLQYLFFDNNKITSIGVERVFPESLKVFSITENKGLLKIRNGTFSGLQKLETVDFTGCYRLHEIEVGAFDGTASTVSKFKANMAGLTSLSPSLLNWKSCDVIELEGNAWDCDCNLQWMQDGLPRDLSETVSCLTPYHLRGRSVDSLDPEEMDCTVFTRYRHKLGVALIILVTIIFLVTTTYLVITYRRQIFGPCSAPKPKGEYKSLYNATEVDDAEDPAVNIRMEDDSTETTALKNNPAPTPV